MLSSILESFIEASSTSIANRKESKTATIRFETTAIRVEKVT